MGMFDTVSFKKENGEEEGIQFKSGHNLLYNYEVGSAIDIPDGIHYGYEGAFVVFKGIIVAVFDSEIPCMYDKWGGQIDYPELN